MKRGTTILQQLEAFAGSVATKMSQATHGEPEDQLRAPLEAFLATFAESTGWILVPTGEAPLKDNIGRPDYAIHLNKLLTGYVELKAPGTGANASRFKGRNREQWKRFSAIPNILYTDGNEWALYRSGQLEGKIVKLSGDVASDGKNAVTSQDAAKIEYLLRDFLSWQPIIPTTLNGKVDLKAFAGMLAPLCRLLREDVTEALTRQDSPLVQLASDWRQLLFPNATDGQFADAYAQTVTFALLLGRSEGADPLTLDSAEKALASHHSLLSRALRVLTDPEARKVMPASLDILLRIIAVVPTDSLKGPEDPWLYFYEDFLAAYDPELRKNAGAYYTPVEVVHAQVRLIDELLVKKLKRPLGFADPGVVSLDPGAGTGTYLLGVVEHALRRIEKEQGEGSVPAQASVIAANIYGFEIMVGPFAVAELRVSRALQDRGATLPTEGPHIYLTDTLENPLAEPPKLPLFLQPIADQQAKALKVKSNVPVIVCLGNPPYDRHEAATVENKSRTGGWVRWGDNLDAKGAILSDFIEPATKAGHGGDIKNLYNLYVYFWRWALWKVFEHDTAKGPGVVSFISASSFIEGDAFCGMREHMRRLCDELWILDIGGEGRGTRQSDNVFAIQTPVAIAVAVSYGKSKKDKPAQVHYASIEGTRDEKLAKLDSIVGSSDLNWQICPDEWKAQFRPSGTGRYFDSPLLTDLMPWQHSGVQFKRTWPIAPNPQTLEKRWRALLATKDRAFAFHESGDRVVSRTYRPVLPRQEPPKPIAELASNAPVPEVRPYAYRSFDRCWIIADGRLISRPRPELWRAHSDKQLYLVSLFSQPLGFGPALTATCDIPDLDCFRGSYGAKAAIPLYRDFEATQPNIAPGLLEQLASQYGQTITPEDFLAYVYGLLAQPAFTERFHKELETRELRLPLTKNAQLFEQVAASGRRLLWLHTYGRRFFGTGRLQDEVPKGKARCVNPVPQSPEKYPDAFEY